MFGVDMEIILKAAVEFAVKMVTNLEPTVKSMFMTLLTIDLILSMLFDESDGLNIFMKLVKKIFYYCFFWYIILNYKDLVFNKLFTGFVQLGNLASQGSKSVDLNWGTINKIGAEVGDIAFGVLGAVGFTAVDFAGLESAAIIGLGMIAAYVLFFLMLYVQVVTVFIKFYFMAGFAFVLMPFAGFDKTKDITLKALNGLFSQAIEIFVTIVIVNFLDYLDDKSSFAIAGDIKSTTWTRWVLILFMYFMLTRTGAMASSLMSGAIATLGIGSGVMSSSGSKFAGGAGKVASSDVAKASKQNAVKRFGDENNGSMIYKAATALGNRFNKKKE